ncbi:MAG TPA: prolyl oligopeptidase family serine peptidase [Rhabdochlamydiaceae bacterium]|nr:prolyl oligopeptidase family serine peptidase [Rhabdochlamydiaceae bacterium]
MLAAAIAPFGSWKSPITTDVIVQESLSFQEIGVQGTELYFTELRPSEKGRVALVKLLPNGQQIDLVPEMSIRNRVHEYGGAALTVGSEQLFFTNDKDRNFYTLDAENRPVLLIKGDSKRFADATIAPDGKTLVLVCEDHLDEGKIINTLATYKNGQLTEIATEHDFYSSPRFSPDGKKLAFITCDFPDMPWDGTTLWISSVLEEDILSKPVMIAGGKSESICQIQWSPDGDLYFVSDKTGFWNLYRLNKENKVEPLYKIDAEFGLPAWVFGRPTYAFFPYKQGWAIACAYTIKGIDHLGLLYPNEKKLETLDLPFTYVQNICFGNGQLYFFGGSPTQPISLISLDLKTKQYKIIKPSFKTKIEPDYISKPQELIYPSEKTKKGYAFYYPPKNPHFSGNGKPPLLVRAHGGPNSRSYAILSLEILYWTSRGFAFLDVNYGGSSGYGREYLQRLYGKWGILDVDDCISAAKQLVNEGKVDPKQLLIKGGSAGGYTTLCALAFHDVFKAGTSLYGISDLELLARDGHKFESHYSDHLVAPYPEGKKVYIERSPIYHIKGIKEPVLLLQGKEDKVVPPNQSILIFEALKKRKIPVSLILFDGEQHGFRMASSIKKALDSELYFYSKILNFSLPEPVESIVIENLKASK